MLKGLLFLFFLFCGHLVQAQTCPTFNIPNNSSSIPVDAQITWAPVSGVIGYLFSLGTTPGGVDIVNSRRSDIAENFYPNELGLPENTTMYITFGIFLPDGSLFNCPGITFRTEEITVSPNCTTMTTPNSNTNVGTDTQIQWEYAPKAIGYYLSVGTASGGTDLINNLDVGNRLSYTPPNALPIDTEIFITITPYNNIGQAVSCSSASFTTGLVDNTCEPFFNYLIGQVERPRPDINFTNPIVFCINDLQSSVLSPANADGYRWFRINDDNTETLLSNTYEMQVTEIGRYRHEAFNIRGITECTNSMEFTIIPSEIAAVVDVDISRPMGIKTANVEVSGIGNYEFALNNSNGPYQESSIFNGLSGNSHVVYIRDKNGCGIVEAYVDRDITLDDFPKFFTPNNDFANDYWQYSPLQPLNDIRLLYIHIYNRYGALIKQIDPYAEGWDGTYNGRPLPASDYWFRAIDNLNNEYQGHFSLKR